LIKDKELIKVLNDFWILDVDEYAIIRNLLRSAIQEMEDQELRDFYVIIKEKIDYIISNGLYKKY
jgi:hypothetical protein